MQTYNIVTNQKIIGTIKKSKYFKVNLGMAVTMEKNGDRVISDKDKFSVSYNYQYKTTIYAQGNVGNIKFYTDYFIKEDKLALYCDLEEFLFDYDESYIIEKGIDSFLGKILKEADDLYKERVQKTKEDKEIKEEKVGDPNILAKNPGAVSYSDIQAYLKNRKIK